MHCDNPNQLTLIPLFDMDKVLDMANTLIDMLNHGKPKKEHYDAESFAIYNELYIFKAINKEKKLMFNVLNADGKVPDGFSANWRTYHHIKQELGL